MPLETAMPAGIPVLIDTDRFPAVIEAQGGERLPLDHARRHCEQLETILAVRGAVLLRGFDTANEGFRRFVGSFGEPPLTYEFGSTPRSKLGQGIYTSTEYPAHQAIPLHNEQSYTREWPLRIYFHCVVASPVGGETPIADSRLIHARMPAAIRERCERRGLMYVRNFGNGFDLPWQSVFDTDDPQQVERYCRSHGIDWEWKDDGELRTRQRCQAVARHPRSSEPVWFNQAHLFHVSNLDATVRETLLEVLGEEQLPRNVYYGDGSAIEASVLAEIRGVLNGCKQVFPWRQGDVLMLDNMLAAHAREPYSGPRSVVVAMTHAYSSL